MTSGLAICCAVQLEYILVSIHPLQSPIHSWSTPSSSTFPHGGASQWSTTNGVTDNSPSPEAKVLAEPFSFWRLREQAAFLTNAQRRWSPYYCLACSDTTPISIIAFVLILKNYLFRFI